MFQCSWQYWLVFCSLMEIKIKWRECAYPKQLMGIHSKGELFGTSAWNNWAVICPTFLKRFNVSTTIIVMLNYVELKLLHHTKNRYDKFTLAMEKLPWLCATSPLTFHPSFVSIFHKLEIRHCIISGVKCM